ncbi:MAG: BrnT family toxin [Parvibaculum sp.]|nr:BrnT family toxin [Parvibaculum sp.]|tara:strand:- start:581 stop:850 length:270 start_codon:yes stop_codon:yes gene_type:complete
MKIEFDPAKNERNIAERQLSFEMASEFDWESAVIVEDTRRDYGERRFRAFGFIDDRLHALVFTPRDGGIRVISLRKANQREIDGYEQEA